MIPRTTATSLFLALAVSSLVGTRSVQAQITVGQTVTMTFVGVPDFDENHYVEADVWAGSVHVGPGEVAGVYHFTTSGNANIPADFYTFCMEVSQSVDLAAVSYTVQNLWQGAANGNDDNIPASGVGADRARNLQILYYTAFGPEFTSDDVTAILGWTKEQRAGFQMAVWELSHDDPGIGNAFDLDVGPGTFYLTTTTAAHDAGESFLNGVTAVLNSPLSIATSQIPLLALHSDLGTSGDPASDFYQDEIIPVYNMTIPEPSTWAMLFGGASLAVALVVRSRQRRRVA